MGKTIMGVAAVSLDGFIADDNDDVGPLFDWLVSGDVRWSLPGSDDEARSSRASADFKQRLGMALLKQARRACANTTGASTESRNRRLRRTPTMTAPEGTPSRARR
jgi:hypothetical protein